VASAAVLPALLALAGIDFLITRNVIAAMVPLVVLAAVAATRTRAGAALIGGLCAIGIVAFAGVDLRHNPPHLTTTIAIQGFTTCALRQTPEFVVVRYCAPSPVAVVRGRLIGLRLVAASPQLLVGP
jgi:hypothetical protein